MQRQDAKAKQYSSSSGAKDDAVDEGRIPIIFCDSRTRLFYSSEISKQAKQVRRQDPVLNSSPGSDTESPTTLPYF